MRTNASAANVAVPNAARRTAWRIVRLVGSCERTRTNWGGLAGDHPRKESRDTISTMEKPLARPFPSLVARGTVSVVGGAASQAAVPGGRYWHVGTLRRYLLCTVPVDGWAAGFW